MKYFIISQPKAGTYFCANLLITMGIEFEGYHFNQKNLYKYNLSNLEEERIIWPKKIKKRIPDSVNLINDNCVGVGHLPANKISIDALQKFKKIILLRPQEETIRSWHKWASATNRAKARKDVHDPRARKRIEDWKHEDNTFVLNFADMKNENILALNNLQEFLFGCVKFDSVKCITQAKAMKSLTKL